MKQHDGSCIILLVSLLDLKNKSKDNLLTQSLIYTLRDWPNLKPTQWNNYCGGKFFSGLATWEENILSNVKVYFLDPKKRTKLKITTFLYPLVFLVQKIRNLFFFSGDNNLPVNTGSKVADTSVPTLSSIPLDIWHLMTVIAENLEVANNLNLNKNRGSTVRGDRWFELHVIEYQSRFNDRSLKFITIVVACTTIQCNSNVRSLVTT